MVHQMHPIVARTIIEVVEANDPAQTAQGVVSSIDSLRIAGFVQGGPLASVPSARVWPSPPVCVLEGGDLAVDTRWSP